MNNIVGLINSIKKYISLHPIFQSHLYNICINRLEKGQFTVVQCIVNILRRQNGHVWRDKKSRRWNGITWLKKRKPKTLRNMRLKHLHFIVDRTSNFPLLDQFQQLLLLCKMPLSNLFQFFWFSTLGMA